MSVILLRTTQELRAWRLTQKESVGFVPTMGNLHQGHLSLLEASLREHPVSVLSIFVNPTQFGPNDDFARYPRTLEADKTLVEGLAAGYPERTIAIFAPASSAEIYPAGFGSLIRVPALDGFLEGAFRPGHFDGVATVVYLLFSLVKPRTAYFGRKDYQQYRVIKRMARDLELPVHVKGLSIIRDQFGLALSSRNQYLSAEQKDAALILYRTLAEAKKRLAGEARRSEDVRRYLAECVRRDKNWQYLELREARTLSEAIPGKGKVVLLGVYLMGGVRLLDNLESEIA